MMDEQLEAKIRKKVDIPRDNRSLILTRTEAQALLDEIDRLRASLRVIDEFTPV